MTLLPERFMPYAKSWVALLGVVLTSIVAAVPDGPRWLMVLTSVVTAVGVYLTPNRAPGADQQAESTQPPDAGFDVEDDSIEAPSVRPADVPVESPDDALGGSDVVR